MYLEFAVVLDESELAELVQEVVDARSCCADACSHHFLSNRCYDRTHLGFLANLSQHDEQASQSLFAGIEQLIDQISLDLAVAQQEERDESFRQFGMVP